ncbi:hemolysin family protein [Kocuria sp. HSID16901]|uniref:hemolysin family protein n=1 Tax=Kocuria sp. HSID16901 TaxID=2419505 RepID=UPI00080A8FB2|nr:hemolysin family protein [Kocuria sp. HSID16901]RUQ22366.1 HlyC/CorC family transporter [Kocuria sp. HSID16901]
MNDWVSLMLLIVLLAGNAFFVGGEFAIMSARRSQIEPLAEAGNKRAITALRAMEHVSLMLACCQLGITVCSLLILNVAEPALHHLVAEPLMHIGVPASAADVIGFLLALLVVTFLHVIFGEMVPKNISVSVADKAALWLAPPLVMTAHAVKPVIVFLNWIANSALRLMKVEPKDEVSSTFTLEELQTIVEESTAEGLVTDEDGMLTGALEFSEKSVGDVMVPVDKLVTLPSDCSPHALEKAVGRTGFSRFVLESEDGSYLGYLHVKDVLSIPEERYRLPTPLTRVRSLINLRPETTVEDALATMQRTHGHVARVVSPGGATVGVLFLEDVLEELIGEVKDPTRSEGHRRRLEPFAQDHLSGANKRASGRGSTAASKIGPSSRNEKPDLNV